MIPQNCRQAFVVLFLALIAVTVSGCANGTPFSLGTTYPDYANNNPPWPIGTNKRGQESFGQPWP